MENSKSAEILISSSLSFKDIESKSLSSSNHQTYWQMISWMMFINVATRFNIAYAVNWLSQFLSNSQEIYLKAAKHVFYYLISIIDKGIKFKSFSKLIKYTDTAYTNTTKFKSTTDYIFTISNKLIV